MISKNSLRIVFMGTPEFAVETLKNLVENGYNVVAVVTQPDKPVGRHGSVLRPSAAKVFAQVHNIPVLQPEKMKDPIFVEELRSYKADLQVVVAFRMLPEVVWKMPRFGTFNVHAALLPLYRGAAPINWAIIHGETFTGVTTFFLDHQIDTGRIIMQKRFEIPDDADVEFVYDGLMRLGAELAIETIQAIIDGDGYVESKSQDEILAGLSERTSKVLPLAPKIFKETCEINWNLTAKQVYDFIRGLSPVPAAWSTLERGERFEAIVVKIYRTSKTRKPTTSVPGTACIENGHLLVAASDEWIEIKELQMAGKKRMESVAFLNGLRIDENTKLCFTHEKV